MESPLFLQREAKLYIDFDGTSVFEVPILEGLSFSQATNVNEVNLAEASPDGTTSRRGTARFTDSLAPAEFSFSTYVRPFKSAATDAVGSADRQTAQHHAVEEVLWALFAGAKNYRATTSSVDPLFYGVADTNVVITSGGSNTVVNFNESNVLQMHTPDLYIVLGSGSSTAANNMVYKIESAVLNEASIDFDIDGIATCNWSGFGTIITDVTGESSPNFLADTGTVTPTVNEGIFGSNNFIQNRLSTVAITQHTDDDANANTLDAYTLTLTGGNITFSNNIEYVTPSTMGVVNQPLGHYTGARSVSGSLSCYLDGTTGRSADLFEDLMESSTYDAVNFFNIAVTLGGAAGASPSMGVTVPAAHLEIPTHNVEEVIGMEVNFHALPHSGGAGTLGQSITASNEATLTFIGPVPDNNIGA